MSPASNGGSVPNAGRFALFQNIEGDPFYVTSWDTWEECEAAFPIGSDFWLFDQDTGRKWDRHSKYEWEAAAT